MKRFSLAAAGSTLLFATPALAENFYIRADVGETWSRDHDYHAKGSQGGDIVGTVAGDLGESFVFGAGVGYKLSPAFRADITVMARRGFEVDGANSTNTNTYTVEVDNYTYMATAYLQLDGLTTADLGGFQPYVGAGLGLATNKTGDRKAATVGGGATSTAPGETVTGFAWQLTAGTAYAISSSLALDLGYRYVDAGSFNNPAGTVNVSTGATATTSGSEGDLAFHEVTLGLRYGF